MDTAFDRNWQRRPRYMSSVKDRFNSGKPFVAITMRDRETGEVVGEDEVSIVNQLRKKAPKFCIYCGCPISPGEGYVQGRICGQSNAIMCLDCAKGDGEKYIEGDYGDRWQAWREAHPERTDDRKEHKQLNLERFMEFGSAILVGIGFFVMLLLYVAELFQ